MILWLSRRHRERLEMWRRDPHVTDSQLIYLATNTDSVFPEWLPLIELIRRAKKRPLDWGMYG